MEDKGIYREVQEESVVKPSCIFLYIPVYSCIFLYLPDQARKKAPLFNRLWESEHSWCI